ncbi:CTP synthase [Morus notabilis]|uniref:CTP synthase n=1 Tax=Morus notabilis TaxID=981085 RepID=W9RWD6_9ROSA|nr:CTP synthase [Morus notabilis]
MKYVVVTGGVVSGLGKGVTASSIGVVLKACGLRVTSIKIDPYLNTDAGTMSPFEHGEVFVLDDGGEVDLDLGNYERFLDVTLTRDNNITTGKIYQSVLEKERKGDYLGKTVQVVPHITDAIRNWIESVSAIPVDGKVGTADVCVIELGGTVGDIESMPFIEALRQLSFSVGPDNFCLIHVSLIPVLSVVGEQFCSFFVVTITLRYCAENKAYTAQCTGAESIRLNSPFFSMPFFSAFTGAYEGETVSIFIASPPDLRDWTNMAETYDNLTNSVRIALVGKYVGLTDSYLSVMKALLHACIACSLKPSIGWIAASDLEEDSAKLTPEAHAAAWETLRNAACVLVPGGFGDRGVRGMMLAAKYARENKIPYLGICLGMQISVIEFARSVLGMERANSEEFDDPDAPDRSNHVVVFMPEGSKTHMGNTMRLGTRRTLFQTPDCITSKLYHNTEYVDERHRHRYEVNPDVIGSLEEHGLKFVGKDESGKRMEILEIPNHPFYVGVQFHPEFKSRPRRPSPLFLGTRTTDILHLTNHSDLKS